MYPFVGWKLVVEAPSRRMAFPGGKFLDSPLDPAGHSLPGPGRGSPPSSTPAFCCHVTPPSPVRWLPACVSFPSKSGEINEALVLSLDIGFGLTFNGTPQAWLDGLRQVNAETYHSWHAAMKVL